MWIISANEKNIVSFDKNDSLCISKLVTKDTWDDYLDEPGKIYILQLYLIKMNNVRYSLKEYISMISYDNILKEAKKDLSCLFKQIESNDGNTIKMEPGNYYENRKKRSLSMRKWQKVQEMLLE